MKQRARYGVVRIGAAVLMLLMLGTLAAAQTRTLKNVELCNGVDRSSPDRQIMGCTALIDSSSATAKSRAIAYNNRGNAYIAKGDYDRAILDYNESIKLNADYARAFNNRGVAYQKKGDHDRAIKDFDEAIRLKPDNASAFVNRAKTYWSTGEYDRSARDYGEAIRLKPTLEAVWNGRCWIYAIMGELEAALADCNEALRLERSAATLDSRGLIHLKMGKWDLAIDDYSSALRLDPKLAGSLYGRGLAKLKTGDTTGGNTDISAAKEIESDIVEQFARYGVQ
jgi:tetratricopeptide (TPR) repeat protein